MSHIGNLSKTELKVYFNTEIIEPLKNQINALKDELKEIRNEIKKGGKELFTIEDLVQLFSVSKATIHNWITERKLIKHKIGGRTFFKREDIARIIELSKETV